MTFWITCNGLFCVVTCETSGFWLEYWVVLRAHVISSLRLDTVLCGYSTIKVKLLGYEVYPCFSCIFLFLVCFLIWGLCLPCAVTVCMHQKQVKQHYVLSFWLFFTSGFTNCFLCCILVSPGRCSLLGSKLNWVAMLDTKFMGNQWLSYLWEAFGSQREKWYILNML